MKHFLCRHTFIYVCDVFVRYVDFCGVSYSEGLV